MTCTLYQIRLQDIIVFTLTFMYWWCNFFYSYIQSNHTK